MPSKSIAPFGEWASPISAADTISGAVSFSELVVEGGDLYWLEGRPAERGRQVLMRRDTSGAIDDVTPAPINVRTRAHEYGGGAFLVAEGAIYYSEFSDQRLYRFRRGDDPVPVTPEPPIPASVRYADGRALPHGRLVYVREGETDDGEAVNDLVVIDPDSGNQEVLASGADFYSSPRPGPDGVLAWVEWDHPNMPWDSTRLMVGRPGDPPLQVAGGPDRSVIEPSWSPEGVLHFIDDPDGWWNLYRWDGGEPEPVLAGELEFGLPQWVFGRSSYVFLSGGRILASYFDQGTHSLGVIEDGTLTPIDLGFSNHGYLASSGSSRFYLVGHRPDGWLGVVSHDADTGETEVVKANSMRVPEGYRPIPERITFPTPGGVAHAIYYPPTSEGFEAPEGDRFPLMVRIHGGPTSRVFPYPDPRFVFWTSRGFGIVDVNYRGSTGFGRAYRDALKGNWGRTDVEDAAAAAAFLVEHGKADPDRVVISGGSAGGFTVLAALSSGRGFSAGASYYGVADLRLLNEHTHKFESRYLDMLVSTEDEVLIDRSPLTHADSITSPVILFQGMQDKVVPPEQAAIIADALARNRVQHALVTYETEDHGFRDADNIVHSLESELAFYGEVLGFRPHGDLPGVDIAGQG